MVLTLGYVLFDTGRAELKSGAFSTVDRLATFLRENPERRVAIEGHTDSVGSDSFNMSLWQRPADPLRVALVSRGALMAPASPPKAWARQRQWPTMPLPKAASATAGWK